MTDERLKELLIGPGLILPADFDALTAEAKAHNEPLEDLLIEKDVIRDDQLGQLLAEEYGVPFINIQEEKIDEEILHQIPELVARTRGVIAFGRDKDSYKVAMRNPADAEITNLLEKRLAGPISKFYISKRGLTEALGFYRAHIRDAFTKILDQLKDEKLSREERDEATVAMVDALLRYGHESKASDVHIEPHPQKIVIRFRIDGVMHDILDLPKNLHDVIMTRIKILAKMRTDEHRAAQDGKLSFETEDDKVDVRVSIVPVTEGENVVMRLLSSKSRQYSLSDVGLSDADRAKIESAIENPHGMILVTGPTGSGKTTTVYAMLKILNTRDVHIATIEDPVEYEIDGVSQIQVNTRTNLTFAKGLRAIVRQDPDIIMVGEIRDEETADIAINSAMTGHLVLSTLHANDAATTLPRLLDMKVEPFLVASTVNIVIAQRLVRKICEKCRASHEGSDDEKKMLVGDAHLREVVLNHLKTDIENMRLYKGAGCPVCAGTGYLGRVGVFEVLLMTPEIKQLIAARAASSDIMHIARTQGMTTMLEDGIDKVVRGITTIDEVIRATKE
ncbi:MAG: type II/IV secretion system protein [Candidatus Ryanbacteria bacterium]|nr:type II/IV secretion system protein [Candidatus Ryanbacteria bacterium]